MRNYFVFLKCYERNHWIYSFLILSSLITLLYLPSLNYGFVWDDESFLLQNVYVHSLSNLFEFFTNPHSFSTSLKAQIYRPIRNISFAIEWQLFGPSSFYFHLSNMIWHIINSFLMYAITRVVFKVPLFAGLILSFLFAIHPLTTEVVSWVKSRDDLLCFFFLSLVIILFNQYIVNKKKRYYLMSLFFGAIALLSKETGIILPGIIFLIAYFQKKNPIRYTSPFILLTFAYLFLRSVCLGQIGQSPFVGGNFFHTQLGMGSVYFEYFSKMIFPLSQRVNYQGYSPFNSGFWIPAIHWGLILTTFFILILKIKEKKFFLSLSLLLITFFPTSNIVPMMQWGGERFLYTGLPFFLICMYFILKHFKLGFRLLFLPLVVYCSFLLLFNSLQQNVWKDEKNLGLFMLHNNPQSYHGLAMVMEYNSKRKLFSENIDLGKHYFKKYPNELFLAQNYIYALINKGMYQKAKQTIDESLEHHSKDKLLLHYKEILKKREQK